MLRRKRRRSRGKAGRGKAAGEETGGDKYIPICSVVDTAVVWTLGLLLFLGRSGRRENICKKVVTTPIFISILIGLALTTLSVPVPALVMDVVTAVGDTS